MFSNTFLNALRNVFATSIDCYNSVVKAARKKMYLGTSVLQVILTLHMHRKTCSNHTYNTVLNAAASSFLEKCVLQAFPTCLYMQSRMGITSVHRYNAALNAASVSVLRNFFKTSVFKHFCICVVDA